MEGMVQSGGRRSHEKTEWLNFIIMMDLELRLDENSTSIYKSFLLLM